MDYWIIQVAEAVLCLVLLVAACVLAEDCRGAKKEAERARAENIALRSRLANKEERANRLREKALEAAAWQEQAEKALIEAERARKECAMHEKERRQLEEKILHLKEEYEAQAVRADELMRREMENFLGYNGTERGQKELNDDTDG